MKDNDIINLTEPSKKSHTESNKKNLYVSKKLDFQYTKSSI